jgi:hypothetical protein
MRVFEANHQGYHLLERRITDEVAMADDEGTLFRANSIAARLFGTYVRMTSLPFIWKMLVTSVNALNDNALEAFGSEQGPYLSSLRSLCCTHRRNACASSDLTGSELWCWWRCRGRRRASQSADAIPD